MYCVNRTSGWMATRLIATGSRHGLILLYSIRFMYFIPLNFYFSVTIQTDIASLLQVYLPTYLPQLKHDQWDLFLLVFLVSPLSSIVSFLQLSSPLIRVLLVQLNSQIANVPEVCWSCSLRAHAQMRKRLRVYP